MNDEQYNKGGYAKYGLKKEYVSEVHSRARGGDGKVYRGEAGRQLLKKRLEKQRYMERNA
jgi:hypothetical protein